MTQAKWADSLTLRDEVVTTDGSVGDLQMSLGKVVFQTEDVPYQSIDYWCEITQPTDSLIGVFSKVARRLWSNTGDSTALFQFDQGMGGGKSHALVGLYHMARDPEAFFATDIGQLVLDNAEAGGRTLDFESVQIVALVADRFSPGKPSDLYGPAKNLFERFMWSLFPTDRASYDHYVAMGPNKQTIGDALSSVDVPVLILLDELMDYISEATSKDYLEHLPDERAFLNALFDACDDVPNVVFLMVMIRSDSDQAGYSPAAQDFREFIHSRVQRNGIAVRVTESKDFINIIRRRIFTERPREEDVGVAKIALAESTSGTLWQEKAFDQLPGGRNLTTTLDRIEGSYPFHPDLVNLVQNEWSSTVGFQRVRSTVRIFAATALHWTREHEKGNWVPTLIGIGDLPLDGPGVLDNTLNSGLLLDNDAAVQGFANLASTDVISLDGTTGRAVALDEALVTEGVDANQPAPSVRMATALFNLSLVNRDQGVLGAVKPELLAAIWEPGLDYTIAEEVFAQVTDPEEGLGSLESSDPGNNRNRYWLSIKKTLNAIHKSAKAQISPEAGQEFAWSEVQRMAGNGTPFDRVIPIDMLGEGRTLNDVIGEVVEKSTRLVVLDPRQWSLANGNHEATRHDVEVILGGGREAVSYYASSVVAVANSHNRRFMFEKARDVLAWQHVVRQIPAQDEDTLKQAKLKLKEAGAQLQDKIKLAYRHYVYTTRGADGHTIEYRKFEDDKHTSIRGLEVWSSLVADGRAVERGNLPASTLATYLRRYERPLTPKEVVESFYTNPGQVLVPSTDDITKAWDSLIGVAPHSAGGWKLVGSEGNAFHFDGPNQIALTRFDATFQEASDHESEVALPTEGPDVTVDDAVVDTPTDDDVPEQKYLEYRISIPSKSLGSRETHKQIWTILSALSAELDPLVRDTVGDQQVLSLNLQWTRSEADLDKLTELVEGLGGSMSSGEPLA